MLDSSFLVYLRFRVDSYARLLPELFDFLFFFKYVLCIGNIDDFFAELFEPVFRTSFGNVDPSQPRANRLGNFFKLAVGVDVPVLIPSALVSFLHLVDNGDEPVFELQLFQFVLALNLISAI